MRWWHPDSLAERLPHLRCRADVLSAVRRYFLEDDFLEVETPILQVCPGMEPHLRVFETTLEDAFGQETLTRYLHTSPEFSMKKLLVAGVPKLFQFARVFRNGETSTTHHPEFTMLEWYRAHADYHSLMEDCGKLLQVASGISGRAEVSFQGMQCCLESQPQLLTVSDAFLQFADIDLNQVVGEPDEVEPDPRPLAAEARRIGISVSPQDRWEDIFFKVMLEHVEPRLGNKVPTILYDYPVCQAALSRRKAEDPRFAERFELYVSGVELANGFSELTDPDEQQARFAEDAALRKKLYGSERLVDHDFLDALRYGMPQSAGIALGVDRLIMLVSGAQDIRQVLWAPVDVSSA